MKIYRISSNFKYKEIYLEEDEDDFNSNFYGQGEKVFRDSKIRPPSTSTIRDVAINKDSVIGAVSDGWNVDRESQMADFSFDVAVNELFRGKKIGTNLITRAIQRYESEKDIYNEMGYETRIKLEVVNLRLAEFLLKEFGFKVDRKLPDRVLLWRQ